MNKIHFVNKQQDTFAVNREWLVSILPEKITTELTAEQMNELLYNASDDILRKAFLDVEASGIEFVHSKYNADFDIELSMLKDVQKKIKDAGAEGIIQVAPMMDDDFFDLDTSYINKEIIVNGKTYSNLIQPATALEAEVDSLLEGKKPVVPSERRYPELPCGEILKKRDENGRVEGYVHLHISDMIDNTYEDFLDILSSRLIGSVCLSNIDYETVALADDEPNTVILKVSGFVDDMDLNPNETVMKNLSRLNSWYYVNSDGNPTKAGEYWVTLIYDEWEDCKPTGRRCACIDRRYFADLDKDPSALSWIMDGQPTTGLAWTQECGSGAGEQVWAWMNIGDIEYPGLPEGVVAEPIS